MHSFNIDVAVTTDEGLIAAVVKDEVDGRSITISNMGNEGIDAFTSILNAGEAAILGMGRIRSVWPPDADGKPERRSEVTLSLTIDHRVVDGVPAARYLGRLTDILSQPELLIR